MDRYPAGQSGFVQNPVFGCIPDKGLPGSDREFKISDEYPAKCAGGIFNRGTGTVKVSYDGKMVLL